MTVARKEEAQLLVRKSVVVDAPQAHAFKVFTKLIGNWWPLNQYHIGAESPQTAIVEPAVGGRWFERSVDGTECDWGRVLVWEPPHRIVLTWDIGADWKYDPELGTQVEVRFLADGPEATRVELEHRHLERYGAHAGVMRETFDSDGGWGGILQAFAESAGKV